MRIALLVAGALPDGLPDYHAVFTAFLRDAVVDPYDVVHSMAYPSDEQLGTYDAVVYTGSAANAFDDVEWINTLVAFTARVIDSHPALRLIAICFGHQIIARALGASCVRNDRWEVGPTSLALTPLAQSLFATDSLTIQQMHRDHVPTLPPSTLLLASTPTAPIQAFVRFFPSRAQSPHNVHILSIQGHPEFTEPIVSHLVAARADSAIIPPDLAADYHTRRHWPTDGVVVANAISAILAKPRTDGHICV